MYFGASSQHIMQKIPNKSLQKPETLLSTAYKVTVRQPITQSIFEKVLITISF